MTALCAREARAFRSVTLLVAVSDAITTPQVKVGTATDGVKAEHWLAVLAFVSCLSTALHLATPLL
jgi:hypothetical protein